MALISATTIEKQTGGLLLATAFQRVYDVIDATLAITDASTSRSIHKSEAAGLIISSAGSGIALTLAADLPDGFAVAILQGAAGAVTVQAGAGATLRVNAALTAVTNGQYAIAQILKIAAGEFVIFGNLVAA